MEMNISGRTTGALRRRPLPAVHRGTQKLAAASCSSWCACARFSGSMWM